MPYANSGGVRIHYQIEGTGQPLILQHGFSGSIQGWHENGYVEALKHDYQLILVDARGHGASDKPHDPKDYEMCPTYAQRDPSYISRSQSPAVLFAG